jgi:hypothetical protein
VILKGTFYVNLEPVFDRAGKVAGFKPVSVTQTVSRAKGVPVELNMEIDSAVFEPLKISAGTITIPAPSASAASVQPPPPSAPPAPTTAYGRALAKAQSGSS